MRLHSGWRAALSLAAVFACVSPAPSQSMGEILDWAREKLTGSKRWFGGGASSPGFRAGFETGPLLALENTIQLGRQGGRFEYVEQGGQDEQLFAFRRYEAELDLLFRHRVVFLYQPLRLETRALLRRDLVADGLLYPEGTPLSLVYAFPYYRLSYLYDFLRDRRSELSLGLSLQIRNALIEFASLDGELFRARRDIGPVPLLKLRFRAPLPRNLWIGGEVDGIYAGTRLFTGEEGVGAFLGAALRMGIAIKPYFHPFVSLRYIGGGSRGEDPDFPGPGDGFARNWIHYAAFSLGFRLR